MPLFPATFPPKINYQYVRRHMQKINFGTNMYGDTGKRSRSAPLPIPRHCPAKNNYQNVRRNG
jgi:hypothetical protein